MTVRPAQRMVLSGEKGQHGLRKVPGAILVSPCSIARSGVHQREREARMASLPWAFEKDDSGEVQEHSSYLLSALADAREGEGEMLVMVMGLEEVEVGVEVEVEVSPGGLRSLKAVSRDERDLAVERRRPQPPP